MISYRPRLSSPRLSWQSVASSPKSQRRLLVALVVCVAAAHISLAITSVLRKSLTFDEIAHMTAGYSYWRLNDYRLHPENGNLPQRWMTLPLLLHPSPVRFPELATEDWRCANVWQLGDAFFHRTGNDLESMLLTARAAVAVISVGLCMLVFFWSRRLFGSVGGVLSLVVCGFSPTVLAHGRLATSDLSTAFFFTAAVWSIWELLHVVSAGRLLAGAAAVSGLFLCKTSAVLILPMAAVMALVSLIPRQTISVRLPGGRCCELTSQCSRRAGVAAVALLIGVAAFSSVWAAHGFRYSASADGSHQFYKFQDIDTVAQHSDTVGKTVRWLARHRLLPEAYLYGVAFVAAHEQRPAFLNGEYSTDGWSHFFPYCLAVKTPLALMGLFAMGMAAIPSTRSQPADLARCPASRGKLAYHLIPVAVALGTLWLVFLGTQLNIGHRHILPTYPFMFVLVGAAAHWCRRATWRAAGAVVLLATWLVAETLASFPHYLSYFNQLVPREHAYRHLVDSSLDWGQDLPSLKDWIDRNIHPDESVYLGYFGTASPAYYGIHATSLPLLEVVEQPLRLSPGTYCISATCLQAVYGFAPGRWNQHYESRYQELSRRFTVADVQDDVRLRQQWDMLRVRRLAAFLRHRDPDAHAGYSILIYRLTTEELDLALQGPPTELDPTSWVLQRALEGN